MSSFVATLIKRTRVAQDGCWEWTGTAKEGVVNWRRLRDHLSIVVFSAVCMILINVLAERVGFIAGLLIVAGGLVYAAGVIRFIRWTKRVDAS